MYVDISVIAIVNITEDSVTTLYFYAISKILNTPTRIIPTTEYRIGAVSCSTKLDLHEHAK